MIKFSPGDTGIYTVRLYPNIAKLAENIHIRETILYDGKEISINEYWELTKKGKRPFRSTRYFSYALVDDVYGLFSYSKSFYNFIQFCSDGGYCIEGDGNQIRMKDQRILSSFSEREEYDEYLSKLREIRFPPFNIFDLTHGKALKFEIVNHKGFLKYKNLEIVEDPKWVVFKPGVTTEEEKQKILDFLNFHIEDVPE